MVSAQVTLHTLCWRVTRPQPPSSASPGCTPCCLLPFRHMVLLKLLCAIFPTARFKLLKPSPAYERLYKPIQRKLDFCLRGTGCIAANHTVNLQGAIAALLQAGPQPGTSQSAYGPEELKEETPFVAPQLAAFVKASARHFSATRTSLIISAVYI